MSTLPRLLEQDLVLDSFRVPKGTVVGMQNYVHHRDPILFPEPKQFKPERWLGVCSKEMGDALTPFSLGSRNCIGQNLAKLEMIFATSKIFRSLKLTLDDTMTEEDMEMEDRFAAAPRGRKLIVKVDAVFEGR